MYASLNVQELPASCVPINNNNKLTEHWMSVCRTVDMKVQVSRVWEVLGWENTDWECFFVCQNFPTLSL